MHLTPIYTFHIYTEHFFPPLNFSFDQYIFGMFPDDIPQIK